MMREPRDHSALHRYVWWPLLVCAGWLGAVAIGMPWPAVLLGTPCVAMPILLAMRGVFPDGWLPLVLRLACMVVPLIVVHALNPGYYLTPYPQSPPPGTDIATPMEVWSHIARAETVALIVVEITLLAVAHRRSAE